MSKRWKRSAHKRALLPPWVPVLYFMASRWYKRASNLPRAGITISKPRKARHCCGQISGWHRFSPLQHNAQPYRKSRRRTDTPGTILSLPAIFSEPFPPPPPLPLSLNEEVFLEVWLSMCHSILRASSHSPLPQTLPPSSTSNVFLDKKSMVSGATLVFLDRSLWLPRFSLLALHAPLLSSSPLFIFSHSVGGMRLCGPVSTAVSLPS